MQLERVSRGEPVNLQSMARQLMESGVVHFAEIQSIFSYDASASDPRLIQVLDTATFDGLRQRFPVDALSSRLSAALAGDSHRVGVSGCMVIMGRLAEECPSVGVVKNGKVHLPWSAARCLVIVENEELLLQRELLKRLLIDGCTVSNIEEADIMLGGGTRASSKHHGLIYGHYKELYFLLDPDLGGLKAFKSALALIDDPRKAHFLMPDNIELILESYSNRHGNKRLNAAQRQSLEKYIDVHPDMDRAVELISKYQCMPEQEVYLALMEISLGD